MTAPRAPASIASVLVANRGEIALRVLRTCREMGIRTVAVHSDADAHLPFVRAADLAVRLGPASAAESYLDLEKILAIAVGNGVDAIHPGYGFLAENAEFSRRCQERGVTFIGPPPAAMRAMGDKAAAKRLMEEAGVPVLPGYRGERQEAPFLAREAAAVGFPVLLKAVAGGGGRGIRLVERPADFAAALESAQREAQSAFGDGRVMIERYLPAPHHVEFQILADLHGAVVHLFERECSVQRRHQKIVEETPSPLLTPELRGKMGEAAVAAARAAGYAGAGTVEFLVDGEGRFYFLEMNTRLQVEHPVTEMTLDLDLVRMQIEVAEGCPLALRQEDLRPRGHAIECRLNAENPARGFLPSVGTLRQFDFPAGPGLRVDAGFVPGASVSPYYDSLLAKLIAWGGDRAEALRRMRWMLAESRVTGIATNLPLLQAIMAHPEFAAGQYTTRFMETHGEALVKPAPDPVLVAEQVLAFAATEILLEISAVSPGGGNGAPAHPSPWDSNPGGPEAPSTAALLHRVIAANGWEHRAEIRVCAYSPPALTLEVTWDGETRRCAAHMEAWQRGVLTLGAVRLPFSWDADGERRWVTLRGVHAAGTCRPPAENHALAQAEAGERLRAPLPGKVIKVAVGKGQQVAEGDVLLILEAMKVEHKITAPYAGTVSRLPFREGDLVNRDDQLVEMEPKE
jgi:3-methylcrotonyl-CoA carboxylase alpha subunit